MDSTDLLSPLDSRAPRPGSQRANDSIQASLLILAGLFLVFYSAALTISPAIWLRSSNGPFRWDHWIGVLVWAAVFFLAHRQSIQRLPGRDPFLLPAAALLIGWGLLTIWSILPGFGLRQSIWLLVSAAVLILGFRLPANLRFLRRYKYVWLTGSLLLTALTLFLGVNPLGYGPRMWLGLFGVYFQPSEPLKLLLIAYLAAYMADRQVLLGAAGDDGPNWAAHLLPLVAPTLVMVALAIALLGIQRDLGTASILLFLYAVIVYVSSQRLRVLLFAGLGLLLAAGIGALAFDVVAVRMQAWLNPWQDPSGRSYQIVQSIIAVANGGVIGRGPGLGSPELVPVSHSDLIFAAVAEQTGLLGQIALLSLVALIVGRGLLIVLRSPDNYRRYLAAGLTAYLAGQSLWIIGGALRLLPLTGITLPFVSYGGTSLLVSTLALLMLLIISGPSRSPFARFPSAKPYLNLAVFLGVWVALAALAAGWWALVRSPALLTRTDNPRRSVSDLYVRRGALLDRDLQPINASLGAPGEYTRQTLYPDLSNVVGYTSLTYGQSGLEASLDSILRGLEYNPLFEVWWNHLIYGQPPPGMDVRLTIDLNLQRQADALLAGKRGALVLMNARTGEILAMASHPTFDSNRLDEDWSALIQDPASPLLNRATLGRYPVGGMDGLIPGRIAGLGISPTPSIRLPTGDLPPTRPRRMGIVRCRWPLLPPP